MQPRISNVINNAHTNINGATLYTLNVTDYSSYSFVFIYLRSFGRYEIRDLNAKQFANYLILVSSIFFNEIKYNIYT